MFTTIASVVLLGSISPEPNFVIVSQNAFVSRKKGVYAALGVATGSLFWASLGISGLAFILNQLPMLHQILSYLGGAYLLYMGIKILVSLRNNSNHKNIKLVSEETNYHAFQKGFLTNLSNPKTIVFVSSFFITIIPAAAPFWISVSAALLAGIVSLIWYTIVALLLSSKNAKHIIQKLFRPINIALGEFLTFLGARLVLTVNRQLLWNRLG